MSLPRLTVRQSVEVSYDAELRPRACHVRADVNGEPHETCLTFETGGVVAEGQPDLGDRVARSIDAHPVLIIENCYTLRAVAAIVASHAGRCVAVPSFAELALRHVEPKLVLLGGFRYRAPQFSFEYLAGVSEHVWVGAEGRLERFIVPAGHLRVDWLGARPPEADE